MSTKTPNGCLLIFRGDEWYGRLSQEELEQVLSKSRAWLDGLVAQGKVKGGHALARTGATVTARTRRIVADGPFAETKEAIGGTLVLEVATLEEAITIASSNPGLAHNTTIDIRPLADECPLEACARARARELAAAAA